MESHAVLAHESGSKPDTDRAGNRSRDPSGSGKNRNAAPRGRRRRRNRQRPLPDDVLQADALEDGHDRIIDPREAGAEIYTDHGLSPSDIDADAAKVLHRLVRNGFQAYLVGGCVRDLLAGHEPKDFDIATSATPRQIKKLFRNSRIIGRRFRLVHIHFGNHILEVSTFRSNAPREKIETEVEGDDDPLIRRDNVFGRADEDAVRRDFTVNGLFFDIERSEVIDFVGGMDDIRRKRIEVIGDPVTRLREDPVRMLRAAKFGGRLGFELAADLTEAIREVAEDLHKCATPRLYEELHRQLNRGGAAGSFQILEDTGLLRVYLPEISEWLEQNDEFDEDRGMSGTQLFWNSLRVLDRFITQGIPFTPVARLGVLFVHRFDEVLRHHGPPPEGRSPADFDIGAVTERVLNPIAARLQMPRRDLYRLKQIIVALRRLMASKSSRRRPSPNQVVRKEYFPESVMLFQVFSAALGRYQGDVLKWEKRFEKVTGQTLPSPS